jgi:putative transposase
MTRFARVVVPVVPMHVVHRGNRRGEVFLDDADRLSYLDQLTLRCERHGVELWAYCLMTNHVHLLVVPHHRHSLARVIATTHQRHADRLNRRREQSGHLWQNRYFSTVLDQRHLWTAVRYIERNPVRGGLVARAEDYRWSSAVAHCTRRGDPYLSPARPFPGPIEDWRAWLLEN